MLLAVLPSQISEYWPMIEAEIKDDLPPIADYGPYDLNNILFHLMTNRMTCWLYMDSDQKEPKGFILTTVLNDLSGVRTLLVYAISVFDRATKVAWEKEFDTLRKFAGAVSCSKIGAFVMNKKVIEALEKAGAETRFVFAHFNV